MGDAAELVLHQVSLLAVVVVEELSLWLDPQWFFVELKQLKQRTDRVWLQSQKPPEQMHTLPVLHSQEGEKDRSHSGG